MSHLPAITGTVLPSVFGEHSSQPVSNFLRYRDEPRQDLFPLGSRHRSPSVWTEAYSQAFLESFLQGMPTGQLFLNYRVFEEGDKLEIIDGYDRLVTLLNFLDGEQQVPSSWFEEKSLSETSRQNQRVTFCDLILPLQGRISNICLPVFTSSDLSEEQAEKFHSACNPQSSPPRNRISPQGSHKGEKIPTCVVVMLERYINCFPFVGKRGLSPEKEILVMDKLVMDLEALKNALYFWDLSIPAPENIEGGVLPLLSHIVEGLSCLAATTQPILATHLIGLTQSIMANIHVMKVDFITQPMLES